MMVAPHPRSLAVSPALGPITGPITRSQFPGFKAQSRRAKVSSSSHCAHAVSTPMAAFWYRSFPRRHSCGISTHICMRLVLVGPSPHRHGRG